MPRLNVDQTGNLVVIRCGQETGVSGIENARCCVDSCWRVHGDGQRVAGHLIASVKASSERRRRSSTTLPGGSAAPVSAYRRREA